MPATIVEHGVSATPFNDEAHPLVGEEGSLVVGQDVELDGEAPSRGSRTARRVGWRQYRTPAHIGWPQANREGRESVLRADVVQRQVADQAARAVTVRQGFDAEPDTSVLVGAPAGEQLSRRRPSLMGG